MTTTWSNLQISRGATIQELKDSTPKVIWTDTNADRCCNVCKCGSYISMTGGSISVQGPRRFTGPILLHWNPLLLT